MTTPQKPEADTTRQPMEGLAEWPKVERSFKYEPISADHPKGLHTPTVLVSFPPNDWAARDKFAAEVESLRQSAATPAPAAVAKVTEYNVGRWCLSEDECIAQGIDFSAYERGVADAAKAFGSAATPEAAVLDAGGACSLCGVAAQGNRDDAKKARPPSDSEPWVVADDTGLRITFRTEDAAWRYRDEYTNRLVNPTVTCEPATGERIAAPVQADLNCGCGAVWKLTPYGWARRANTIKESAPTQAAPQGLSDEREAFEKWFDGKKLLMQPSAERRRDGDGYAGTAGTWAWEAWQARALSASTSQAAPSSKLREAIGVLRVNADAARDMGWEASDVAAMGQAIDRLESALGVGDRVTAADPGGNSDGS